MEVLAATAAGLQLSEQLLKVSKGAWQLYQRLATAPQQIQRKRHYLEQLCVLSQSILSISQGPHQKHDPRNQLLHSLPAQALRTLLDQAGRELDALHTVLEPLESAQSSDKATKRFWARVKSLQKEDTLQACIDRLKEVYVQIHYLVDIQHLRIFCQTATLNGKALEDINMSQVLNDKNVTNMARRLDLKTEEDRQTAASTLAMHSQLIAQGSNTHFMLKALSDSSVAIPGHVDQKIAGLHDTFDRGLQQVTKELQSIRSYMLYSSKVQPASKLLAMTGVLSGVPDLKSGLCTCRRSGKMMPVTSIGPIWLQRQLYGIHNPGCPWYTTCSSKATSHVVLALGRIALTFHRCGGVGRFYLPSSITFITIVGGDERKIPGFSHIAGATNRIERILEPHGQSMGNWNGTVKLSMAQKARVARVLTQLYHDLQSGFNSHQISGHMQTSSGATLLHSFSAMIVYLWHMQSDVADQIKSTVRLLHDAGTTANAVEKKFALETDDRGNLHVLEDRWTTALAMWLPGLTIEHVVQTGSLPMIQTLSEFGVSPLIEGGSRITLKHAALFLRFPDLAIEFGCSKLALAVINRNYDEVRTIVHRQGVHDAHTPFPLTPLCFCIGWPQGMALLLTKGADPSGAVHCAVAHGDDVCLKMLLDAGSRLMPTSNEDPNEHSRSHNFLDEPLLEFALEMRIAAARRGSQFNPRILPLITCRLAQSRKELMDLARSSMPGTQLERLGWKYPLRDFPLLDGKLALRIFEQLRSQKVDVPDRMQPDWRGTSVYHSDSLTTDVASELFAAGFYLVDIAAPIESSTGEITPLLQCLCSSVGIPSRGGWLRELFWFLENGASNFEWAHLGGISLWHLLAAAFALEMVRSRFIQLKEWQQSFPQILHSISDVLPRSKRDSCRCHCSAGGCSVATILARYTVFYTTKWIKDCLCNPWKEKKKALEHWRGMVPFTKNEFMDFARSEVFERLGMKHTCCVLLEWERFQLTPWSRGVGWCFDYYSRPLMTLAEAAEFREEDRLLNNVLEAILCLYRDLSIQYEQRFESFWSSWWKAIGVPLPALPAMGWHRNSREHGWPSIDVDLPESLEEANLPQTLELVREDVASWMGKLARKTKVEDMMMTESMALFSQLVDS